MFTIKQLESVAVDSCSLPIAERNVTLQTCRKAKIFSRARTHTNTTKIVLLSLIFSQNLLRFMCLRELYNSPLDCSITVSHSQDRKL